MRFMVLVIPDDYANATADAMPDAETVAQMMKYNEALQEAGVLIGLDGLHPPAAGARVSFQGGEPTVIDGPFSESKELVGGYWMIDVGSQREAIDWARRAPMQDGDILEIRQVHEMEDFPEDVQAAAEPFAEKWGKKG